MKTHKYYASKRSFRLQAEKNDRIKPCENCGNNRWQTIVKHKSWGCRVCGRTRISMVALLEENSPEANKMILNELDSQLNN